MAWKGTRHLILPAALTVTSFVVVMACGSEDEPKQQSSALTPCADHPGGSCQRCTDDNGKATCGPANDCYLGVDDKCYPGGNS
jgi:hypothetical protein